MGIFGGKPKNAAAPRPEHGRSTAVPSAGLSIIGVGMTVRGDLESSGVVRVEGAVEGNVRARAQVLVAKGGVVRGDIETAEAVIGGSVAGSIRSDDRVEIQAGAAVDGDITTRRISVAEGGSLNGAIRMDERRLPAEERPAESKEEGHTSSGAPIRPSTPFAGIAVPPRPTATQQPPG